MYNNSTIENQAKPFLSVKDVADYLGVSEPLIYKEIGNGALSAIRVGQRILIEKDALAAYLDRNRTDGR